MVKKLILIIIIKYLDPSDFEALIASYFLILMPSITSVEPNLNIVPMSHFQHYRLIKDLHASFGYWWQNKYLQTFQRYTKWPAHRQPETEHCSSNSTPVETWTVPLVTPRSGWDYSRYIPVRRVRCHPGRRMSANLYHFPSPALVNKFIVCKFEFIV